MILDRCLLYLLPEAEFGITDNDYAQIDWQDARPMPTLAECEAAWSAILAQDAAAAQQSADEAANESSLRTRASLALAANDQIIADAMTWLAANPSASSVLRQIVSNQITFARHQSAQTRLILRRFESANVGPESAQPR